MDSSIIPDDHATLLELYLKVKNDFESVKQSLHESKRQLKLNEALIRDYQVENESLQDAEKSQCLKYEAKVTNLEDTLASLRSNHLKNISSLESELFKKNEEADELKNEIVSLKRKNLLEEKSVYSPEFNKASELTYENELLKENIEELQESFKNVRIQHVAMEETLQEYKEQVIELRESIQTRREELLEKSVLIDKLNDELFIAKTELETYKNKPLQDGSKGNSLFAEVDDRRVHLQKTVNDMKSSYLNLKQDHNKHEKLISHLRKENADLRALWKKDLEQTQEDHNEIVDCLNSRISLLEEITGRQKHELENQIKPSGDGLCSEYQFYQDIIESKSSEIRKLEKKLSDRSITEHLLSASLAQAHKELRLLRLRMLDLQQQIKESKEKEFTLKEAEMFNRYTMSNNEIINKSTEIEENVGMNVKSCLRPIENLKQHLSPYGKIDKTLEEYKDFSFSGQQNNFTNKSPTFIKNESISDASCSKYANIDSNNEILKQTELTGNQENNSFDGNTPVVSERRGVQFSKETYSPESNPIRRKGTKIFIMKKKSDFTNGDA